MPNPLRAPTALAAVLVLSAIASVPLAKTAPATQAPTLISAVPADWPASALGGSRHVRVVVDALVGRDGTVQQTRVAKPSPPFDAAAIAAVRWNVYAPARQEERAVPVWISVPVEFRAQDAEDADPPSPDVVTLAREAERRGDLREAIDYWTGALARVGKHPTLRNEWAIRTEVLRVASRMKSPPEVPNVVRLPSIDDHNNQQRDMGRMSNERFAKTFDRALLMAPWWVDAYRWNAAACATSGRRADAIRMTQFWRLNVRDTASRALAGRALAALAEGDTLAVFSMLK